MKSIALLMLCALPSMAAAADELRPADFAASFPISLKAGEGLHVATLPVAVYAAAARRDLGDLRVFNGAGETLPYALLAQPASEVQKTMPVQVPIFPLWAQPGTAAGALTVRVEQGENGAIVGVKGAEKSPQQARLAGYIVDTSAVERPLQALSVDWDTSAAAKPAGTPADAGGFAGFFDVDASDDLKHWTPRAGRAPLVTLHNAGQSLSLNRIELPHLKSKYLRLSWPATQTTPALTRVIVEPAETAVDTPRTWQDATATRDKDGDYEFDMGAQAPFDRLRLELPNQNTIATVQLQARFSDRDRWLPIAAPTVFRLTQGGHLLLNPDIVIGQLPARYWRLHIDQRTSIGDGTPKLSAGFVPQKIVFAARGAAPFVLACGAPAVTSAGIPLASLVPGYRDNQPLAAASATLGTPEIRAGGLRALWFAGWSRADWKKLVLWGILAAGVALLAWMALRLGHKMNAG